MTNLACQLDPKKSRPSTDNSATMVAIDSPSSSIMSCADGRQKKFSMGYSTACNLLITVACFGMLAIAALAFRGPVQVALTWAETRPSWQAGLLFIALFFAVSFPCMWGYLPLNLACGYIFGIVRGLLVVTTTAAVGVFAAHCIIKRFFTCALQPRLLLGDGNNNAQAVFSVLAGPHAFRVVLLARLTPVPFGLQNAVFAASKMTSGSYMLATVLGLLPTQFVNVYLGSTFRSMEDVLLDDSAATVGWIVFAVQICIGFALMAYVIHWAKKELKSALEAYDDEEPLTDTCHA